MALAWALEELRRLDERKSRVVEMRFLAGMTLAETAEALGISRATAERDWITARAWLYHHLRQDGDASGRSEPGED